MDEAVLAGMNGALAHRGPDDQGLWHGGHVALAMRRLSVIDRHGGHQPMTNEDGSVVLVYNGEIYNAGELRGALERRGCVFRTRSSDTEVVLRAYEAFGDEAVHHFNGMFALAIYDRRQDRLVLARDRLGIKPLYYAVRDGALAFASELDALLRSGLVRGTLNPAAVDAYFTFLYVPAPDTIFQDAQKLCPGEMLVFRQGTLHRERYWRLRFQPDETWTLSSAAEAYLDLLKDAVRLRRVSDVPLGAFLSGGIDSSSVVGALSMMSTAPIKTFTIGFEDADISELRYARIVADHFGTDHTEEIMRPDMVHMAAALARHFGEPFADSSAAPTWLVSKVAREHVTVALSGDGGDELFAGYTWTHRDRNVHLYRRVPASIRRFIDGALCVAPKWPRFGKLRRFNQDSFLEPYASFRRRHTCFSDDDRRALYHVELARAVQSCVIDRFREHAESAGAIAPDDWLLYQDTVMYLPDDILTKVDRMSMAHSLEVRVPLLDHRLVEFAATVPFSMKLKGNISKRVVKRALKPLLPRKLLRQRKQGFAIPVQRWFRGELRGHFEETVLAEDARCTRLLERAFIKELLQGHVARREDYGHHLWTLLMFEHWLRYVDTVPGVTVT